MKGLLESNKGGYKWYGMNSSLEYLRKKYDSIIGLQQMMISL